jgi:Tfp pilus assembly protein PilW
MSRAPQVRPRGRSGQSLVELAISLTVMLLLLVGAVSFGMAFFSYVAMRDAAQEGALYGSFNPYEDSNGNGEYDKEPPDGPEPVNLAGIRERVRDSSTSPVDFSDTARVPDAYIFAELAPDTALACEGSEDGVPNAVRVIVQYDFPIFMPFVGAIVGDDHIHMTAAVTDTILEPRCPP